jgi:hypothetical protein
MQAAGGVKPVGLDLEMSRLALDFTCGYVQ